MVARVITKWPDPFLLNSTTPIKVFDEDVVQLAKDLADTMKVHHGAGLAAPQIRDGRSACVITKDYVPDLPVDPNLDDEVFLGNPLVKYNSQKDFVWNESCLSIENLAAKVYRYNEITVEYYDTLGKFHTFVLQGSQSATIQHETDQLVGKLFIHRLEGVTRMMAMKKIKKNLLKLRAQEKAGKEVNKRRKSSKKKRR